MRKEGRTNEGASQDIHQPDTTHFTTRIILLLLQYAAQEQLMGSLSPSPELLVTLSSFLHPYMKPFHNRPLDASLFLHSTRPMPLSTNLHLEL